MGVNITFHRDYIHRPAHADAELRVAAALDDRVLVIRLFPGLREQVLRAMLSIEGLRAVVLETYGAGNAPTAPEFIRAVREAVARGLLVMNVTQCSGGRVAMSSTKPAGSCRRPASSAATTSPPKRPSPN